MVSKAQPYKVECDEHGEIPASNHENARIIKDYHYHVKECEVEIKEVA